MTEVQAAEMLFNDKDIKEAQSRIRELKRFRKYRTWCFMSDKYLKKNCDFTIKSDPRCVDADFPGWCKKVMAQNWFLGGINCNIWFNLNKDVAEPFCRLLNENLTKLDQLSEKENLNRIIELNKNPTFREALYRIVEIILWRKNTLFINTCSRLFTKGSFEKLYNLILQGSANTLETYYKSIATNDLISLLSDYVDIPAARMAEDQYYIYENSSPWPDPEEEAEISQLQLKIDKHIRELRELISGSDVLNICMNSIDISNVVDSDIQLEAIQNAECMVDMKTEVVYETPKIDKEETKTEPGKTETAAGGKEEKEETVESDKTEREKEEEDEAKKNEDKPWYKQTWFIATASIVGAIIFIAIISMIVRMNRPPPPPIIYAQR